MEKQNPHQGHPKAMLVLMRIKLMAQGETMVY